MLVFDLLGLIGVHGPGPTSKAGGHGNATRSIYYADALVSFEPADTASPILHDCSASLCSRLGR